MLERVNTRGGGGVRPLLDHCCSVFEHMCRWGPLEMVAQMIIRGKFEAVMAMKTIDRARRSTEDGKTVVIPSLERPRQRLNGS